ncbi:MAG: hypothetical protein RL722_805 [Pseudomonadota bacterium]
MKRVWLFVGVISLLPLGTAWLTDSITLEGERTIYTATCEGGDWSAEGDCGGRLMAAERYRFRALRAHSEVLFWTVGDTTRPSGKFSGCTVQDSRNWRCPGNEVSGDTITHQMNNGLPQADGSGRTRSVHLIEKWRWLMLRGMGRYQAGPR